MGGESFDIIAKWPKHYINCNDVTTTSLERMDGKGNYSMSDLMMSSLQLFFFILWKFGEYCAARIGTCSVLPGAPPPLGGPCNFVWPSAIPEKFSTSVIPRKGRLRGGSGLAHGMPLNIFCATRFYLVHHLFADNFSWHHTATLHSPKPRA